MNSVGPVRSWSRCGRGPVRAWSGANLSRWPVGAGRNRTIVSCERLGMNLGAVLVPPLE